MTEMPRGGNTYAPAVQGPLHADEARVGAVALAHEAALAAGRAHAQVDATQLRFARGDALHGIARGIALAFLAGYAETRRRQEGLTR